MNKDKKKDDKHNKVIGKLLQQLTEVYPDSLVDGIHALKQAMMIQFKALSLVECDHKNLEKYGKELIWKLHEEFKQFIDQLNDALLKTWKEDKTEEIKEGENDERF